MHFLYCASCGTLGWRRILRNMKAAHVRRILDDRAHIAWAEGLLKR